MTASINASTTSGVVVTSDTSGAIAIQSNGTTKLTVASTGTTLAGTTTITTLSDGTNSTSSTNCIQGSAKAWVQFNGSTAAIAAAYNVTSITKNSTGNFTANFTTAFADTAYSFTLGVYNDGAIGSGANFGIVATTVSAGSLRVITGVPSIGTANDSIYTCISAFR